jgi:ABC-type transport system involved in multi-copper enzyme maturation permease subunit
MTSDPPPLPAVRRARLDAFEAVFQVAQLTARRALTGWRVWSALGLALLPAALAALVRAGGADEAAQERFFYGMLSLWQFGITVPVSALLFATAFPWPEAEEGTLTYWFTSPVPRWTVMLGRWLASLAIGSVTLAAGVLAVGLPLRTPPGAETEAVMRSALAATLMAYPAYLALFQLVATRFRWGLVSGVVFVFVENFVSLLTGTIVKLTLIFYVRSLVWPAVPRDSRGAAGDFLRIAEPASSAAAVTTFAVVAVLALGLSLLLVQFIEYRGRASQQG